MYDLQELNQHISVDCVLLGFNKSDLSVVLIDRNTTWSKGEKLKSGFSLVGYHVYENEEIEAASKRILFEIGGIKDVSLHQFGVFASPLRLEKLQESKNRVITVSYYGLMNPDRISKQSLNKGVSWFPVKDLEKMNLVLDHEKIIKSALDKLKEELFMSPEILFDLLPVKFTLGMVQDVYETILGVQFDKRNFRKKILRMKYLVGLDQKQSKVNHKPANLYMFSKEVYQATKKELFDFNI